MDTHTENEANKVGLMDYALESLLGGRLIDWLIKIRVVLLSPMSESICICNELNVMEEF